MLNESLGDLVRKHAEMDKILEFDNELIQNQDPVYLDPVFATSFRSHFFAPRKLIFGSYVDTFHVNLMVIWSFSLILYLMLYYDAMRKGLEFFERIIDKVSPKKER